MMPLLFENLLIWEFKLVTFCVILVSHLCV